MANDIIDYEDDYNPYVRMNCSKSSNSHCVMPGLVVEKLMAPMTGLESFEIGPYTPELLLPFMGSEKTP